MKYNYYEAVKNDALEYIKENNLQDKTQEELYDELFISDSVTGNASGSYYCNTYKAEEALAHNTDLLIEALNEFGYLDGINGIEYGIDDHVYCVSGAWGGGKAFHRVKIQYTRKGAAFFVVHGYRIPLDECIRMGA